MKRGLLVGKVDKKIASPNVEPDERLIRSLQVDSERYVISVSRNPKVITEKEYDTERWVKYCD